MRLLFLDESGRIGQDSLFALGGVGIKRFPEVARERAPHKLF